ncbi:penicillin acylase family protein [Curvibacter sp. PAE-UM]|uniref:penicillin acylase family protein n=1 Tax=Curvibacter sp. PAE-UM TaxID=1714344 RepID=UPI000710FF12|nr:penicillin acylase family protein [Curvibacter sp. PAE-UM]KRI01194.1 penicillin amidase [Curvibacter sp. PAE-UM]
MKRTFKVLFILLIVLITALAIAIAAGVWHARSKLPQRSGTLTLSQLKAPVLVNWDERGVPHLQAQNEIDLYRALGFLHAQDRLFQMEMVRRLARGELAEILGPKLLDTDRLFRTLELRAHAEERVKRIDRNSPAWVGLLAYLDGINEFQDTRPLPVEFDLLRIQPQHYTPVDTLAVAGYLAYSFAATLRTEPVLSYVRDQLGPDYLQVFDLEWQPLGVVGPVAQKAPARKLAAADWQALARVSEVSQQAMDLAGVPLFEGSNAWAISGRRTASGKPLLAGDPHIAYALPAVWYEAHLSAPGFELYGHHQALNPFALLGHNKQFGWSLTMFQNDDMDLVALKVNPDNPRQVWHQGQWVALQSRTETITVKNADPVNITLTRSPHGPLINQAFPDSMGQAPIAMWWTFLETENPILDAFHELNRADTLPKARAAASKIHAPGLNVVWANAAGDIGWWAAARLVQRPPSVNPSFILDGGSEQADKPGYYRFADNPQEENPARGYIVSANHQPVPRSGVPVPGYYNLPERARRLDQLLRPTGTLWNLQNSQALQLDEQTDYAARVLGPLLPLLREMSTDTIERALIDQVAEWDGRHSTASIAPTVYNQFVYELLKATMADELGEVQFNNLLRTRAIDHALPRLVADPRSPWWDDRRTEKKENRSDTVQQAWRATLKHLQDLRGLSLPGWTWGKNHTVTHGHPLGRLKPLDKLFDVGPLQAPGGREIPNNLAHALGPAPWSVNYGPSTRRLIDFADAGKALGINPVGQSGALFDPHYADQAQDFIAGRYQPMHLNPADVKAVTRSTLVLQPAP